MKKLIFWAIVVIGIAALFYFLKDWQPVSMVIAAVAGPFKFIYKLFGDSEQEIRKKHAEIRQKEKGYQQELESSIQIREKSIEELEGQITILDKKLATLNERKAKIDQEVENMNLDELQETGRHFFGE